VITLADTMPLPAADLSISDLWPIYHRRKRVFYAIFGAVVLLVALYCAIAVRRYTATGSIEVQNESLGGMELSDVFNGQELTTDAMTTGLDLETQANILKSDSLALRVIRELNLENSPDFQRVGYVSQALNMLSFGRIQPVDSQAAREARALHIFSRNLKIKTESGTRIINISYRSMDSALSGQVVNHLIQALIEFNLQTRSASGMQASEWLSGQLGDLRKQSEGLQSKVVQLQQEMGVFSLGDTDATGKQQIYSTVLDQVQQATAALTAAQSNRILKGALYQVVKSGNPELISGLTGNAITGSSSAMSNSLVVIQTLREQEASLTQDIAHDAAKFGDNYPPLNEKRAALAGLDRSISDEDARIAARAKSDYDIAVAAEQNTRNLFEQTRQRADQLNNKAIEFTIARKEADETRSLYEDLTKRLREAGLVQGLRSSNIATIDPGRMPAKPSSPNILLLMAAAVGAGLFLGSSSALFLDIVDRRVQTVDEIERGHLPLIGVVPHLRSKRGGYSLADVSASHSAFHQAMRSLRASLMTSNVLKPPRVVLISSALPGEGKTTIAKGLSVALAQQGRKVLLIEADLYRPRMNADLGLEDLGGLSLVLRQDASNPEDMMVTPLPVSLPGLRILEAGNSAADSIDLLESDRMSAVVQACREKFDVIVIDGPPILPVTDAVSLSMLADTTILVARMGRTPQISLRRAANRLNMHKRQSDVRVALNAVKTGSYAFHDYYGSKNIRLSKEGHRASA
jgi:succinoglycan biosynthesis transport protein ExoP